MDSPERSARERYLNIMAEEPALFNNSTGQSIRVLTDPLEITAAEAISKARLSKQELPQEWSTVGLVYEDQYVRILRDAVEFPDGKRGTYSRIMSKCNGTAGVAVLPILGDKILLLRHFRHATRKWHNEIPRGFVDADETEEHAAKRELLEEIGVVADTLTRLGGMYTNTGLLSEYVLLFAATISTTGTIARSEGIDGMRLLSTIDVSNMIARCELSDSFTLAAILMARQLGMIPGRSS